MRLNHVQAVPAQFRKSLVKMPMAQGMYVRSSRRSEESFDIVCDDENDVADSVGHNMSIYCIAAIYR
jgi:hypothetical protein